MFKKYFRKIYKLRLKKIKEKFIKSQKLKNEKYISILNHDVKTILLAQIQALELFINNKAPKEILYEVLDSNYFIYEIVKNTIFLSDYENKKINFNPENVDITSELGNICKSVENLARFKKQNIIVKTSNKNIICKADKLLINKIMRNIITGSISNGFENSDIEISIKENKNSISFSAKNKSVYMTKEKIKNILEDKKASDFNQLGMNLNLNVANKLITAHDWKVIACSNKDNTSTFGFVVKK